MRGVIRKRREFLRLMRTCTLEQGYFTVTDIQKGAGVPRSTAQDWINRLLDEGCVVVRERKMGRIPARYAAISALPSSACRRIFTTTDGDRVEIHHECMSSACAAFCAYHHSRAGGVLQGVERDGTLLREWAHVGRRDVEIGLFPASSVGVAGVEKEGSDIIQHIRCIGGPAYSLTDMMAKAEGVCEVKISREGKIVEGSVRTRALVHLVIGVDDTDSREGGATFALALALLQHLETIRGVLPISHHVVMLNPAIPQKTAGNSCSYIEVAIPPGQYENVRDRALFFVQDESLSPEWGIAMRRGFSVPPELRAFGERARREVISIGEAEATATRWEIDLFGGRGRIGALAALALSGLPHEVLLRPFAPIPPET
ncbi:MAG: sugar-specific transcriptional regulator TrmB [Methanolinea sp.]|nr:sugar-specific transcriptional regulator TrmB [Methanolinea sp.]